MNLTPHFTLEEVTQSSTASRLGIDNTLPEGLVATVLNTARGMEKVRGLLNTPISVDSWYRCIALNAQLGSAPTSQHIKGEAVDFISPLFGTPVDIVKKLIEYKGYILFDQLIYEHTWVHISWNSDPNGLQRGQVLSLLEDGKYAIGVTDKTGKGI